MTFHICGYIQKTDLKTQVYMDALYINKFMHYISCLCEYTLDIDMDTQVDVDNITMCVGTYWWHVSVQENSTVVITMVIW